MVDLMPDTVGYSQDAAGGLRFAHGDPDVTVADVASITKVMTLWLARQWLPTDPDLDQTYTIDSTQPGPRLFNGDVLTVRDMFYAAAMPSDNTAPGQIGTLVGNMILASEGESGNPLTRFRQEMNAEASRLGYVGANFTGTVGHGTLSPRQVADLFRRSLADPALRAMYTADHHTIAIVGGPEPRHVEVAHTIISGAPWPIFGYVGGKTGTASGRAHVVVAWDHPDGTEHISVILYADNSIPGLRYTELEKVMYADMYADETGGGPEPVDLVNLITNPRGRTTGGTVTLAENLLSNPSFEVNAAGWTSIGTGVSIVQQAGDGVVGDGYLRTVLSASASTGAGLVVVPGGQAPASTGQWAAVSAWVRRAQGGTETVCLWLNPMNGNTNLRNNVSDPFVLTGEYQRIVFAVQLTQATTDGVRLYVRHNGNNGNGEPSAGHTHLDALTLAVADTEAEALAQVATYGDGDTWNGDPDFTPGWVGTAHNSVSRLTAPAPVGWTGSGIYYSTTRDGVLIPADATATPPGDLASDGTLVVWDVGADATTRHIADDSLEIPPAAYDRYVRVTGVGGPYDGDQYDGDTPAWSEEYFTHTYTWDGEPHESTSTYSVTELLGIKLTPVDQAPAPAVGITVEGLDPNAPTRLALYRQISGQPRTLVQGAGDVSATGAGYWVDYLPPLGRTITYMVDILEGAATPDVTSAQFTIESETAWLQDALNPLMAIEVAIRPRRGQMTWFTTGAFDALERAIPAETIEVMASRFPAIMQGARQAPASVPFPMITAAAEAASQLRTVLTESRHLVLRVPPVVRHLDAVVYLGGVSVIEDPRRDSYYGGTITRWDAAGTQVRGPRIGVYTALWTYDDIQAMYEGQTYAGIMDGRTYVDWQRAPNEQGMTGMGAMSDA